jgi:hypothetical protein
MNNTKFASESTVVPKLLIQGVDQLAEPHKVVIPCDEAHCLWRGGHVAEDWDPVYLHQALIVDEDGFTVEVNRSTLDPTWTLWAELHLNDGQTTSAIARDFTLALEIAEDIAAELNRPVTD